MTQSCALKQIPKWIHSAQISKLVCPFLNAGRHTKKKSKGGWNSRECPLPTEELLEHIPLAGSVVSGLRHYVLII